MRVQDLLAQLDDAVAGLADEHAWTRSLDDDTDDFLVALDIDAANVEWAELLLQEFTDDEVGLQSGPVSCPWRTSGSSSRG